MKAAIVTGNQHCGAIIKMSKGREITSECEPWMNTIAGALVTLYRKYINSSKESNNRRQPIERNQDAI
jgi:hypothetical protein